MNGCKPKYIHLSFCNKLTHFWLNTALNNSSRRKKHVHQQETFGVQSVLVTNASGNIKELTVSVLSLLFSLPVENHELQETACP